jgi:hypothetical protein
MNAIRDARAPWLQRGSAKAVLYALASFADAHGWSWPSLATLGAAAGLSERRTGPVVAKLEQRRVLQIVHGSQHKPNRYRIAVDVLSSLGAPPREDETSLLRDDEPSPLNEGQRGRFGHPGRTKRPWKEPRKDPKKDRGTWRRPRRPRGRSVPEDMRTARPYSCQPSRQHDRDHEE